MIRNAAAAAAVAALAAGVWWLSFGSPAEAGPIRAIAVLPLENLSGDPDQDYFADGLTEALITELAKLPSLRVISRTSVLQYKGARRALPEIARELGVEGILEGTVLRSGDQVRITTQLIDARTDHHLWADRYDRGVGAVLEIHSEVARAVADEIAIALTPGEAARLAAPPAVDPRAQDAYFRGLAQRGRWEPEGFRRSIEAFEEAIAIEPDFALAHAALAKGQYFLALVHAEPALEQLPLMKQSALRALELAPDLAEAHGAMATVHFQLWDWEAAEREYRRAAELGVRDPVTSQSLAFLLLATGRRAQALELADEVIATAPLDPFIRSARVNLLVVAGENERALAEIQRSLELDADRLISLVMLRAVYESLGRLDEALDVHRRLAELFPEHAPVVAAIERAWRTDGPEGYWRVARQVNERRGDFSASAFASVRLGEIDAAFATLDRGLERRDVGMPLVVASPAFDPLRTDPRFAAFAARMDLPLPTE